MTATPSPQLLVVSADEILAEVTSFRLELLGYSIRVCRSAEETIEQLKQQVPALFLIQLDLPGMSGPALIELLATENNSARIPILAISMESEMETVERTITAGASDYLVVPFDLVVLEQKVASLLALQAAVEKNTKQTAVKG